MKMNSAGSLLFASMAALQTAAQVHVFVDDDAQDGGDGLSWSTAFNDLDAAIALADSLGVERGEIRVAAGWYQAPFERSFAVPTFVEEQGPGMSILGGFGGLSNPQSPDERDLDAFATVLSRQGVDQGAVFEVLSAVTLDACGGPGVTSACVLTEPTLFSGLRFVEDQALCVGLVQTARPLVEIDSCRFEGCHAFQGGAIAFDYGKLVVTNSMFKDNTAERDGGAIYAPGFDDEVAEFESCVFEGNTALSGDGGAIDGAARAADCDFIGNSAGSDGGAVSIPGFAAQTPEFIRCWFERNAAGDDGGAVDARSGVVWDCMFVENEAGDNGGAASGFGGIQDSSFLMNTAGRDGGAIYGANTVGGCLIEVNHAGRNGGGINNARTVRDSQIIANSAGDESGGVHAITRLIGTTLDGNTSVETPGGGRFIETVTKCDIRNNAPWGLEDVSEVFSSTFEDNGSVAVELADGALMADSRVISSSSSEAVRLGDSARIERTFIAAGPEIGSRTIRVADGAPEIVDSVLVGTTETRGSFTATLFTGCTLVQPSDEFNRGALHTRGGSTVAESCVIQSKDGPAVRAFSGETTLLQCLVPRGEADFFQQNGLITVLGELFAVDPLFTNAAGADGDPLTFADNDYRPTAGSPLIDRGADIGLTDAQRSVDIDGSPRSSDDTGIVNDGIFPNNPIDIGAYEFQGTTCLADVNLDGDLTPADFSAWILAYSQGSIRADMNRDGSLQPNDYTLWIVYYQIGC